jgi:hypothetical protein
MSHNGYISQENKPPPNQRNQIMNVALYTTVEALAFQKKVTLSPLEFASWALHSMRECEAVGNELAAAMMRGYWLGAMKGNLITG